MSSAMEDTTWTDEGLAANVTQYKIAGFVGPSGVGKSGFYAGLPELDNRFRRMVSVTTRQPRPSDLPGEYEYIASAEFVQREAQGLFLWTFEGHNACYGTLRESVQQALQETYPTVMHLEPGSVPKLLAEAGESVCLFFITAPREDIEGRLRSRDKGKPESYFQERLDTCSTWEAAARDSGLPYHFIDNLDGQFNEALRQVVEKITTP